MLTNCDNSLERFLAEVLQALNSGEKRSESLSKSRLNWREYRSMMTESYAMLS
jgi:hypothetical protein